MTDLFTLMSSPMPHEQKLEMALRMARSWMHCVEPRLLDTPNFKRDMEALDAALSAPKAEAVEQIPQDDWNEAYKSGFNDGFGEAKLSSKANASLLINEATTFIRDEREGLFAGHQVNGKLRIECDADRRAESYIADMDRWLEQAEQFLNGASITTSPVPALTDEAERFESADWFFRTMDPDDSGDSPAEAIHSGMIGHFVVCKIASSFNGPTRYGFNAPVLDPESDDEEFLHFASEDEAIAAAKFRAAFPSTGGDNGQA